MSGKGKAEVPGFMKGPEYADKVVNYLDTRTKIENQITEDEQFLAVVGTPGHTNGSEKDQETLKFLGERLKRHKQQLEDLEATYRAGKNLEEPEDEKLAA